MLSFDQVTYRYENNPNAVLKNVSFSVKQGERLAVVGRNGSGKSTLARVMKGLSIPTEGKVTHDRGFNKDDMGLLFQNPDNQMVASLVEDDLAFGLENKCVDPAEISIRLEKYSKKIDVHHLLKRDINELSGGQKQRVALAGLLVLEPAMLILDEATSMLDPGGRETVMNHVHQYHNEGNSVISVTHDVEEILFSNRVLGLVDGELVFDGEPHRLFTDETYLSALGLVRPFHYELIELLVKRGIQINQGQGFSNKELLQLLWTYRLKT